MPELPEVTTITSQLKGSVVNKKIKDVIIKDKRLIKAIPPKKFKSKIKGKTIKDILRRGKVLVLKLDQKLFFVIHLRISGWLMLSKKEEQYARVILALSDNKLLNFCDMRALGEIKLVEDWRKLPIIKTMGPEPLEIKKENFIELFKNRKAMIKPLIMDQKFLAGLGNIYAQEALFCAGINPERKASSIKKEKLEKLYDCLISILKTAITKKGSSSNTYRQLDGAQGSYIPLLKVYQREAQPCFRCKTLIKRKVTASRGTYFCPQCQR